MHWGPELVDKVVGEEEAEEGEEEGGEGDGEAEDAPGQEEGHHPGLQGLGGGTTALTWPITVTHPLTWILSYTASPCRARCACRPQSG